MKLSITITTIIAAAASSVSAAIKGQDVSNWQGTIDWNAQSKAGSKFTFIKATEGTGHTDSTFSANYKGAYEAGIARGAYHFALPDVSSGSVQANYFLSNGGGWSNDGKTLPGALDIEYNPYGANCYGLSKAAMADWIHDFGDTYKSKTGRFPVIYTTADWWNTCVGKGGFEDYPLWVARYASSVGSLPIGFSTHSFWQFADSGALAGDQNNWNGDQAGLDKFVKG